MLRAERHQRGCHFLWTIAKSTEVLSAGLESLGLTVAFDFTSVPLAAVIFTLTVIVVVSWPLILALREQNEVCLCLVHCQNVPLPPPPPPPPVVRKCRCHPR